MRASIRRRLVEPLRALLRQGATPERLALSVALGVVVGNIPLLGVSTAICVAIALLFRLNLAAIQIAQAAMAPTQLLLIVPFLRLEEWLTRSAHQSLSAHAGRALLAAGVVRAVTALGLATLHALLAWLLVAPVVAFALYRLLTPIFERAAAHGRRRDDRSHRDP